uniref:CENP-V/GFA domain-containing protein n=1 Tax=Fusarium oxysporum (strain Fo5176) TaxID=660025 RepID=A0A0D2XTV5_FUSOF
MPLPNEPVKVTGGCSCGAIRYRINVPALDDRPLNPFAPPACGIKLPGAITCHCNDCRRSTGSFLATGILDIPAPMLTVSAMSPSSETDVISGRVLDVLADDYDAEKADADRPPLDVSRSFCGRCGTQLCFHFKLEPEYCADGKLPDGWRDSFHLYLGTLDREFLEKDWFNPDSEVNFKHGTPLSRCVSATAKGLKDLPKMQEFDGQATEEELATLRT